MEDGELFFKIYFLYLMSSILYALILLCDLIQRSYFPYFRSEVTDAVTRMTCR